MKDRDTALILKIAYTLFICHSDICRVKRDKFEDTNGVPNSRKSRTNRQYIGQTKNRQYIGQTKKYNRSNKDPQNTTHTAND
jgi:hypothetical protein